MKKIKIKGRSGLKHEIIPIEDNLYKLILDKRNPYCRFIGKDDSVDTDNLYAVDPDGGPMIAVGEKKLIPGETIMNIYVEDDQIYLSTYA